jgi:hypothetical protein
MQLRARFINRQKTVLRRTRLRRAKRKDREHHRRIMTPAHFHAFRLSALAPLIAEEVLIDGRIKVSHPWPSVDIRDFGDNGALRPG